MAQPTPYVVTTDFSQEEANGVAGRSTVRTAAVDVELDNIALTLGQTLTNLALIQRDDGRLADASVSVATLASDVLTIIGSAGFTVRGSWVTATAYAVKDVVKNTTGTYLCIVAHTSGTFATDLAAGKWAVIFDSASYAASSITFTPTGTIAATNAQAAIAEAASEAVQKASNGSDFANLATTRTNMSLFSRAEIQASSSIVANAGGTVDAITATFTPAIAAWVDDQLLLVECAGANTSTTPTFDAGPGTPKTIVRPDGTALVAGDIPGANFRAMFVYDASLDKVLLLNPYYTVPASVSTPTQNRFLENVGLTVTMAANAVTIALTQADGTAPSSGSPSRIGFRNATITNGQVSKVNVTGTLSTAISSGSTGGTVSGQAGRIWIGALLTGSSAELCWYNALSGTSVAPINEGGLITTTAEGGAGAADSAQTWYSTTARTNVPVTILGYFEATEATAGTWATGASAVVVNPRYRPGDVIQVQRNTTGAVATGTTALPRDDTIPQITEGDQFMTQAITPIAAANLLDVEAQLALSMNGAAGLVILALFQDATAGALAVASGWDSSAEPPDPIRIKYKNVAAGTAATTFRARAGNTGGNTTTFNGVASGRAFGGVMNSFMEVKEIVA